MKKEKGWFYIVVSLVALASIMVRPIIACQIPSEIPEPEKMACCKVQGSCHITPEERADCCQEHSSMAGGEPWKMVLPLKWTTPLVFFYEDSFLTPYAVSQLCYSCYVLPKKWPARSRLPSKIFLLKSSLLI